MYVISRNYHYQSHEICFHFKAKENMRMVGCAEKVPSETRYSLNNCLTIFL
jgi:hypothetical protein